MFKIKEWFIVNFSQLMFMAEAEEQLLSRKERIDKAITFINNSPPSIIDDLYIMITLRQCGLSYYNLTTAELYYISDKLK